MDTPSNETHTQTLSTVSTDSNPFPLTSLLYLYETGHAKDLYVDNYRGLRLLIDWLGPIGKPDDSHSTQDAKIPKLLGSYDLQRIAVILEIEQHILLREYIKWNKTRNLELSTALGLL